MGARAGSNASPQSRLRYRVVRSAAVLSALTIDVGPAEDRAFWTPFLRSLVKRGLRGVRLVTSDAHEGLKHAIAAVLTGEGRNPLDAASSANASLISGRARHF